MAFDANTCADFTFFKGALIYSQFTGVDALKQARKPDDLIRHTLNTLPKTETACADLFMSLAQTYRKREEAIRKCIAQRDEELTRLRDNLERNEDDDDLQALVDSRANQA
jgi:hypothetical protein